MARGLYQRDIIIKFEDCYHGNVDGLLAQHGSGVITLSVTTSPGVPQDYIRNTITITFNNFALCAFFNKAEVTDYESAERSNTG